MKKLNVIFLILVLILISVDTATSQLKLKTYKKKPFVVIDVNGSVDLAALNLHGSDLKEFWGFGNYGQSIGYGGEIKFKISALTKKMTQLRPYLAIGYSHFTRDANQVYVVTKTLPAGWPSVGLSGTGKYTSVSSAPGNGTFRMNMPYAALGTELTVYTDKKNLSSFSFGLDFNMTIIAGKYHEYYSDGSYNSYGLQSNTRFGIGGNVIYNFRLSKAVGINIGSRFHFANLIGKSSELYFEKNNNFYLLDENNTAISPLLSDSREIGFFKFFGGVSFYIGSR